MPPIENKGAVLGKLSMLLMTVIWGTSFVILKNTLDSVSAPYILAYRFSGAAVIMFIISCREIKGINKRILQGGASMGAALFMAYLLQTYGLIYTTPGKNAFLTATYCVIVPFLNWALYKHSPDRYNIVAAFVCITGMGLVCLQSGLTLGLGDALTAAGGFFFALHIILTAHFVTSCSIALLNAIQFSTVSVLSWILAFASGTAPGQIPSSALFAIAYLCLMCTAACFFLQTYGQKHTKPSAAAVIMTLESVFGTVISVIFYGEELSLRLVAGFALIFAAILISETKPRFLNCALYTIKD